MKTLNNSRRSSARLVAALALAAAAAAHLPAQVSLPTVVELAQRNSSTVKLADSDVLKARAVLAESHDIFIPSLTFDSGLPAFPEVGFTGALPTIWGSTLQSMVFSMPQIRYIEAARDGLKAAELSQKNARDQAALDASLTYIELDTVNMELEATRQGEASAARLVEIEQQRAEAGVDPLSELLQDQLMAAELKLKRIHVETRATTLSKQLATLTGLPVGSITLDHSSIPEIPAVNADETPRSNPGLDAANVLARSKQRAAKGDQERLWFPQVAFGAIYNRNTTLLNNTNEYYNHFLPANNFSSGFNIQLPLLDASMRAKARESAADALRSRVEAEQARRQNDVQIVELTGGLRELDAEAEVARLKQQIAGEQLKTVITQLEFGNGAGGGAGAPPQTNPTAEQKVRMDEREKYVDSLDASFDLSKARLNLLHALGHIQDWLNELHTK